MLDLALNQEEAAAILGVHVTHLKKMVGRAEIIARPFKSVYAPAGSRRFTKVYSLEDCQRNFFEYEAAVASNTFGVGRKREHLQYRADVIDMLAKCSPQIHYSDAIGIGEAARLMQVHASYVPRLIERGAIAARKPWNSRSKSPPRSYIVSRVSCEKHLRVILLQQHLGKKPGVPRKIDPSYIEKLLGVDLAGHRVVDEGRKVASLVKRRERKRRIVELKKQEVLLAHNTLRCEACGFDFSLFYGPRGSGYAECHHRVPIGSSDSTRKTSTADLAIVCANCHRMLHQTPTVTVEDLRRVVQKYGFRPDCVKSQLS